MRRCRRFCASFNLSRPDVASVEIDAPHLLLQRKPREAAAIIEKFLKQEKLVSPGSEEWATRKAAA